MSVGSGSLMAMQRGQNTNMVFSMPKKRETDTATPIRQTLNYIHEVAELKAQPPLVGLCHGLAHSFPHFLYLVCPLPMRREQTWRIGNANEWCADAHLKPASQSHCSRNSVWLWMAGNAPRYKSAWGGASSQGTLCMTIAQCCASKLPTRPRRPDTPMILGSQQASAGENQTPHIR